LSAQPNQSKSFARDEKVFDERFPREARADNGDEHVQHWPNYY